jgi:hypothetical protein
VDQTKITPEFVKTFDREKPRTIWYNTEGKYVKTGDTNSFELKLMDCFTYVNDVMALKLPSGKLVKSHLNKPKLPAPEVQEVPEEVQPDIKPINVRCLMDNIAHTDEDTLLARRS